MSSILECIRTVGRGERGRRPLTFEQAYQVMDEYLAGQIDDDQMAMLMMLIRVQNETREEIAGFVRAFQSRVPNLGATYDWPCYAGKRASAGKPWHLLAAKILAGQGEKVVLHGFHEAGNGREHAENYLQAVGIYRADSVADAQESLQTQSIVYLPLEAFAPQAARMLAWKARYGLRTPVNTVVRALNPGGAEFGIRGSFHPGFQQLHAEVEHSVGHPGHAVISFKGVSGESEYNPKVSQTVWLSSEQGVQSFYWPEQFLSDLPIPNTCPLGTPAEEMTLMANAVLSTLATMLFTRYQDREKAFAEAFAYWMAYCSDDCSFV
ncbi:glycosyl transferase family protein [Vibrio mangrovi]|uniref:Glycosyl transferase family protein n=1 Tax=Vibrio mangrovi TaxID=474394 RepID=A0A1Y6IMH3_9VIBR|nr:glycosyl transferase family protein [Vibrio mangrovi]MDW6004346.1 glycosyl transferase family protein [Vibrio mangrovi]SMR98855.1 hypothetical protein VIM7927_00068 [Vibrio mangrovi]